MPKLLQLRSLLETRVTRIQAKNRLLQSLIRELKTLAKLSRRLQGLKGAYRVPVRVLYAA